MRMTHRISAASLVAVLGLTAAACGSDDKKTDGTTAPAAGSSTAPAAVETTAAPVETTAAPSAGGETLACEITDLGGVDDKGFNQIAYEGLKKAGADLGVKTDLLESKSEDDYAPNIQAFVEKKCNVIVTVGFLLDGATAEGAKANPDQQFAIVDSSAMDNNGTPDDFSDDKALPNVRPLLFDVAQPSFMAGYLAAGMTKTGKVGTYGGINIPPVVAFMDGFKQGVEYYNKQKGKTVELLGWDGKDGTFAGNFNNLDDGKNIAQSQLDEGADIVFPVAGPVGLGSSALALEVGPDKLKIIGVDNDMYISNEKEKSVYLTSVLKKIDAAVYDTVKNVADTGKSGDSYLGTLTNGGVGLAEFHDFDGAVSQELKDELAAIEAGLKDGSITIAPMG